MTKIKFWLNRLVVLYSLGFLFDGASAGEVPKAKSFLDKLGGELAKFNIWKESGEVDVAQAIAKFIQIAMTFAGVVAIIFLIRFGGYEYIMAGGNPEKSKKAVEAITHAIIGLVVILASYLIIRVVLEQVGVKF
ncbi:pilin [Patescibacteria group bacterium]|nr:pilin [Patescibacteria group bacterium]